MAGLRRSIVRGILSALLRIIVILLPTILIGSVIFRLSHPREIIPDTITRVRLECAEGTYTLTDTADGSTVRTIDQLLNEGTPCEGEAPDLTDYTAIGLRIHTVGDSGERDTEYKLFVSPEEADPEDRIAYYSEISSDGKTVGFYKAPAKPLKNLLRTDYARSCYRDATFPVLTSSTGEIIGPTDGRWSYADADGNVHSYALPHSETSVTYEQTGSIRFSFSSEPTSCLITIHSPDGTMIFSGSEEELTTRSLSHTETLEVRIETVWNADEGERSAEYNFRLYYLAPAQFSVDTSIARPGGFVLIRAANVRDTKRLYFASTPDILTSPVYYPDPDDPDTSFIGILPVAPGLSADTYSIVFAYNGVSHTFRVPVTATDRKNRTLNLSESQRNLLRESPAQSAIGTLLSTAERPDASLFCLTADVPTAGELAGISPAYRFGDTLIVGSDRFGADSIFYPCDEGTAVQAVAGGTVFLTGEDPILGRFAAIDHGKGICTWYFHLGTVRVEKGQAVVRGSVLGRSGTSGVTDRAGFGYSASIGQTPIGPESLPSVVKTLQ